jgi:hypothetical protein
MLIAGVGAVSIAGVPIPDVSVIHMPVTELPVRELSVESVEAARGGAMSCMRTTGCTARSSPDASGTSGASQTGGVA